MKPLALAVLVALAISAAAMAQSSKTLSGFTVTLAPDSGVAATVVNTVDVIGTVGLSPQAIASMTDPECTRAPWQGMPIDAGVTAVPYPLSDGGSGPLTARTQAIIRYASSKGEARCDCVDVGQPLPTCDTQRWFGKTLESGDVAEWSNLRADTPCYCTVCDADSDGHSFVEIMQGACR